MNCAWVEWPELLQISKLLHAHVLYEGPSLLDGEPIVAILTGLRSSSGNRKTGAMLQTWILRADVSPAEPREAELLGYEDEEG